MTRVADGGGVERALSVPHVRASGQLRLYEAAEAGMMTAGAFGAGVRLGAYAAYALFC